MKRTELKRTTPLKSSGKPLKRTALKADPETTRDWQLRSAITAAENASGKPRKAIRKESPATRARRCAEQATIDEWKAKHPWCEWPGCHQRAVDHHHSRGKVGDLRMDTRWWKAACRYHHGLAHNASGDIRRVCIHIGWIVTRHRGGEIDEDVKQTPPPER